MTQFEKWKRAARHRFKMSYKRTLAVEREKHQKELDDLKDQQTRRTRDLQMQANRDIEQERAKAGALAKEIARVRFEYGPTQYSNRFTMYATMDQSFMLNAQNLKDMMPYVIKCLVSMISREFGQIDFTRVKPVIPERPPGRDYRPTFRIDSGDTSFDDMRSW